MTATKDAPFRRRPDRTDGHSHNKYNSSSEQRYDDHSSRGPATPSPASASWSMSLSLASSSSSSESMVILQSIPAPDRREASSPLPPKVSRVAVRRPFESAVTKMLKSCWHKVCSSFCTIKLLVLLILCLQNSMFTVTRRYSQGVLKERYSKYEVLLMGEVIKMIFSAWVIGRNLAAAGSLSLSLSSSSLSPSSGDGGGSGTGVVTGGGDDDDSLSSIHSHNGEPFGKVLQRRLVYIIGKSEKMMILAAIYGAMNILSFVSLRNIGAGMFTIFAQCKILTTATFSTLMLNRQYSFTKWRALIGLMFGVLLFSEPTLWGPNAPTRLTVPANGEMANQVLGTLAVLIEVTLSGFASIYFEKVIKKDPLQLNIWERNFQLALTSFPVYICFIIADGGGEVGLFGGWTLMTWIVALLGAAGGLLVALSIKYGDSILKTLATTGAIVLSSVLDYWLLDGPLTPTMMIAGAQVILSIFNYTFDMTPEPKDALASSPAESHEPCPRSGNHQDMEMASLINRTSSKDDA